MKKILISVVILGAIGAGIGYYLYNKPVESLENKKADIEVTAAKLLSDYETDENAANAQYLGKIVQVSGTVADVLNEGGKIIIHLNTDNPISLIICNLEDGAAQPDVAAGAEIKVKGNCSGYLSDVVLDRSSIVK